VSGTTGQAGTSKKFKLTGILIDRSATFECAADDMRGRYMTARTLVLLVLIGSVSTFIWAQGAVCTQYNTYTLSGASSCTPGVQANQYWNGVLANEQADFGGTGPNCSYTPNPYNSNCTYGQCYSTAWTCAPPPPPCPTCCPDCSGGGPINLANGNTYIQQSDVRIPGLGNGLTLTRTYNSLWLSGLPQIGLFGTQWLSTYEEQVYLGSDGTMKYARADGSVWSFALYGTPLVYHLISPGNVQAATLTEQVSTTQSTASWTVTFQNGEQRVFNGAYGNGLFGGPLTAMIDRNGNTTSLTYAAVPVGTSGTVAYQLTTVTDPAGRHLNFSYGGGGNGSLVASVTSDPGSGINVTYTYEECSQLGSCAFFLSGYPVLTRVTQADNTFVAFAYNVFLDITSLNDTYGKVLESHTYDYCNGGLNSSRANGVDALTITYSDAPYCNSQPLPAP